MEKTPSILFILVDALRARNLGCYGYTRQTSPNIDDFASNGILFENAFSCTNFTDPSLTTIFSGKYPKSHGILRHGAAIKQEDGQIFIDGRTCLLPEILKSKGYTTLGIDWLGRWHRRGYDYYRGTSPGNIIELARSLMVESMNKIQPLYFMIRRLFEMSKTSIIENAKRVTDLSIELIKKVHNRKFFLFVHYWDTHSPYNPPKDYIQQFIQSDYGKGKNVEEVIGQLDQRHVKQFLSRLPDGVINTNQILARYDAAISFVDHEIGRLMEALERYGIQEQTLVVLTSDHGESLTEHEIYFSHHGLYDVTIHVPLIIRYSEGLPENKKLGCLVQHVDIVPTILDVLNMKSESYAFDGRTLVPLILDETRQIRSSIFAQECNVQSKSAIRTSKYKYIYALSKRDAICRICGRVHGDFEELYDLDADPEETKNLIYENPDDAKILRKELLKWAKSVERKGHEKNKREKMHEFTTPAEEEQVKERLKKLGYF